MIIKSRFPDEADFRYIELGNNMRSLVDKDVFEWAQRYKWYAKKSNNNYYAVRKIFRNGRSYTIRLHRSVCKNANGKIIHHINRNSFDNRRSNLIAVTVDEHRIIHGGY